MDDGGFPSLVVVIGDVRALKLSASSAWLIHGSLVLQRALVRRGWGQLFIADGCPRLGGLVVEDGLVWIGEDDPDLDAPLSQGAQSLGGIVRTLRDAHRAAGVRKRRCRAQGDALANAWDTSANPAEMVRLFALHPSLVNAPYGEAPLAGALLVAALDVVRGLAPSGASDMSRDERRVLDWIERGWTEDDARQAMREGPQTDDPHALATTRLVLACVDFFNACKGWHADENRSFAQWGVDQLASAVRIVATSNERRVIGANILRARLACPRFSDLMPGAEAS
jgi:hypothetical protein